MVGGLKYTGSLQRQRKDLAGLPALVGKKIGAAATDVGNMALARGGAVPLEGSEGRRFAAL